MALYDHKVWRDDYRTILANWQYRRIFGASTISLLSGPDISTTPPLDVADGVTGHLWSVLNTASQQSARRAQRVGRYQVDAWQQIIRHRITMPTSDVAVAAGFASGTGQAYDPTAAELVGTGVGTGTGSAYGANASVSVVAGFASGTGQAYGPSEAEKVGTGVASGTGSAYNATAGLTTTVGFAGGTGAAGGPSSTVQGSIGFASGQGQAFNPSIPKPVLQGTPPRVVFICANPIRRMDPETCGAGAPDNRSPVLVGGGCPVT